MLQTHSDYFGHVSVIFDKEFDKEITSDLSLFTEKNRQNIKYSISPLFVDRFGRSLRFCYIDLFEEDIAKGLMAYYLVFRSGLLLINTPGDG